MVPGALQMAQVYSVLQNFSQLSDQKGLTPQALRRGHPVSPSILAPSIVEAFLRTKNAEADPGSAPQR